MRGFAELGAREEHRQRAAEHFSTRRDRAEVSLSLAVQR